MALEPTTDQRDLRDTVRGYCSDTDGADPTDLWRGLVELGLTEIPFPEELGGAGSTLADTAVVVVELGRALSPAPYRETVVAGLALAATDTAGDELRDLVSGRRTGVLLDGTSSLDVVSDHGATVLRGTHRAVPGANLAGLLCVLVGDGADVRVTTVDPHDDRVTVTPLTSMDATRPLSRVEFHDVSVSEQRPVPAPDLRRVLAASRTLMAAEQWGAAQRCVERSVEYAATREQFGRPIGSFQAVKHRIVDMHVEVELAGAAVAGALELLDTPDPDPTEVDIAAHVAAATASSAFTLAASEAIQVHGGIGFTWEFPLHRFFRRAKATELQDGGTTVHHNAIARLTASSLRQPRQ